MEKQRRFSSLPQEERQLISLNVIKAINSYLQLFISPVITRRIISAILIIAGVRNPKITELTGLSERGICDLKNQLMNDDVDNLFEIKSGRGRKSKIKDVESQIVEEIEKGNYQTLQQIADMIHDKFEINVSLMSVSRLVKKNEIRKLKAGSLPAKADTVTQRNFYESILKPLMHRAKRKNSAHVLFFMDASHFVHGCDFLGGVYSKVRRFVRTFSGRQRYNVLGAINFVTRKVHTVTNTTYITATEICQMLTFLASEYAGKKIHVVLDNARYQKCEAVTALAHDLKIDLVYLPPYSPNLNLIERLWKFTKGKLRVKYYSDFATFKDSIDSIIENTETVFKEQISSLIADKVQLFDDLEPICENTYASRKHGADQAA